MKKVGMVLVLVLGFCLTAEATFYWREVGRAPLMPGGFSNPVELAEKFVAHKQEIIEGIRLAEPGWDSVAVANCLEEAIRSDRGAWVTYPTGQNFRWMIFKGSVVTIGRDVKWSGAELPGYLISCEYGRFFIASGCGNLSMVEIVSAPVSVPRVEYTPQTPQPPVYIERPVYTQTQPQSYHHERPWYSWLPPIALSFAFTDVDVKRRSYPVYHRRPIFLPRPPTYHRPPAYCPPGGWPGGR